MSKIYIESWWRDYIVNIFFFLICGIKIKHFKIEWSKSCVPPIWKDKNTIYPYLYNYFGECSQTS